MYRTSSHPRASIESFHIEGRMLRYSLFIPKLYNLCKSLGFEAGKIMPSRAMCSDESQGFPIILIAKHFGCFPFNHGRVGGIVATDRHGPHAEHGRDLVIIQASHVGYNPESHGFGVYRRPQTHDCEFSSSCGKIDSVVSWYQREYHFACKNIHLTRTESGWEVSIDNYLLHDEREEGLFLHLDQIITLSATGRPDPTRALSTSKRFPAAQTLIDAIEQEQGEVAIGDTLAIGSLLHPEWFHFRRHAEKDEEGQDHLEYNLLPAMPWIVTSPSPLLTAAKVNTQVEFDRTYRTILRSPAYQNRRVLFISGLNIDISPNPGQFFPLTKFIPWAAYLQLPDGESRILEQDELFDQLNRQSGENPDQTDMEAAIELMSHAQEVTIPAK